MSLSCGLNPVRNFTPPTSTGGLYTILQSRAKDYVVDRVVVVSPENLTKRFKLELVQGLRRLSGFTGLKGLRV